MILGLAADFARKTTLTVIVGLLAAVALSMSTTIHANAGCAVASGPRDPVARAPVAFVGTVLAANPDRHRALVRVESVWRGPQLPAQVDVESDVQPAPGEGIADLAIFNPGWRYLFVPASSSQPFKFPACGGPIQYSSDLDRARPSDAHPPRTASGTGDAIQLVGFIIMSNLAALAAAVVLLAVVLVIVSRRRRERADAPDKELSGH